MELILLNKTIELYSAKKKNTKGTEECSVKKPATNSDSMNNRINLFPYIFAFYLYNIYLTSARFTFLLLRSANFQLRAALPLLCSPCYALLQLLASGWSRAQKRRDIFYKK